MAKYKVYYTTKSGENSKCWVEAENESEAADIARDEYWDIDEIDEIMKL